MIFSYLPHQRITHEQIRRLIKSLIKEWIEGITKEMPIVQNQPTIHGNKIFIENKKVCVKLLRSRLETIQKLQPPSHPRDAEVLQV